ncbi:MAG: HAD family hydrolase [Acidimicrobiales bacterium]
MTPIAAVVFDYGGVLTFDPFEGLRDLEKELRLAPGALCDEFRGGALFREVELGRMPLRQFFKAWLTAIEARHGCVLDLGETVAAISRGGDANPAMVELVVRLHPYRLAILTNNVRESRATWEGKVPIERFEVVVDSSEVGLRKPDPAIYRLLLARLDLEGPAVAYVDDFEENLPPAAELGMRTVAFTTAEVCEAALAELGVKVGEPA